MRLHEDSDPVDEPLAARVAEAPAAGLTLPPSFVQFMTVDAPLLEDCADPQDVFVCASSFDEFVRRFWIENTLWYAAQGGRPVVGELPAYAEAAHAAKGL
jgi:hypothetical protein